MGLYSFNWLGINILLSRTNETVLVEIILSNSFLDPSMILLPNQLNDYKPVLTNNILKLSYDKNKTNIKKIIDILTMNQINFKEINTVEGDLEDVFIKVINNK